MTAQAESTLTVSLTGLSGGNQGRQARIVDYYGPLAPFLSEWGTGGTTFKSKSEDELKEMAKSDPAAFKEHMAAMTAAFVSGEATAKPQQIVDAVCNWLVKKHKFLISDTDPGKDVYYVSKGNLKPTQIDIPGDGVAWHIVAAAPFG